MTRWLRHKQDGTIYEWNHYLANNPKLEEVSEEIAFPEKYMTDAHRQRVAKFSEEIPDASEVAEVMAALEIQAEDIPREKAARKGKKRRGIDLHTDDIPEEPEYTNPELNAEASRGLL
jgi:hypothetical protein